MQKRLKIAAGMMAVALLAVSAIAMAAGPQTRTSGLKNSPVFGKQPTGRILGGIDAVGDRSFTVRVGSGCGGTIIADSWVLTAAHCNDPVYVSAGSNSIGSLTRYEVVEFIRHPSYFAGLDAFGRYHPYDYALARIRGTFPAHLIRAKLADAAIMVDVAKPGDPVTVLGWGATWDGGSGTTSLREVTIPVVSDSDCAATYNGSTAADGIKLVQNIQICAGLVTGGKDACKGDSGGPLVAPYNGSIYSIGVVSFGLGCGRPYYYGVYAETFAVANWITGIVGGKLVHHVDLPSVPITSWSSFYQVTIPAGTTKLVVNISGGTGDADLYVRAGAAPTTATFTCRSMVSGNTDTCTINNPTAGTTYFIGVRAYTSYSGVRLHAWRSPN